MARKKKKRTVKHNIHKRYMRTAEASFNNFGLAFATNQGDKCTHLIRISDQKIVKPTRFEADSLTQNKFHWTMHLAVFGRKPNGIEYMEYEVIKTSGQYLQSELVSFMNDRHQQFIESFNKDRIVGAGWVASISNRDLSEDQLHKIFTRLNAWGD